MAAALLLGGGYIMWRDEVTELVDEFKQAWEEGFEETDSNAAPEFEPPDISIPDFSVGIRGDPTKGAAGVRELARKLNGGGMRCRPITVDAEDAYVSSGNCQYRGNHVQINVYLARVSLRAALQSFACPCAFTYVHKDNWFVIGSTPVMRRVHSILGGKLTRADS